MAMYKFNEYYRSIYGNRWDSLLLALEREETKVARINPFSNVTNGLLPRKFESLSEISDLPRCYKLSGDSDNFQKEGSIIPERDSDGLLDCYILDPASVVVALALQVTSGDRVLDMCAAPGGKTLILAEKIGQSGELIANEISSNRRDKLSSVLRNYIPTESRSNIWVKGKDANKYGIQEPQSFDRILLDAPCSGERHLLNNRKEMGKWSLARGKNLAFRQYSLLCSAWSALKPGGRLVYSTCSINPIENDEVIEKLCKKKTFEIECIHDLTFPNLEKTRFGSLFLPDFSNMGPMYFAILKKK